MEKEKTYAQEFGKNLEKIRTSQGYSRRTLAAVCQVTEPAYANYENGYRLPTVDKIFVLSAFLKVSVSDLLNDHETSNVDYRLNRANEILNLSGYKVYSPENDGTLTVEYGKDNVTTDPAKKAVAYWAKTVTFANAREFILFTEQSLNTALTVNTTFKAIFENMADIKNKQLAEQRKKERDKIAENLKANYVSETKEEVLAECQQKMAEHQKKIDSLKGKTSNAKE